jgi:catechol 2,3-dioxygenase-like lactoylglutathione lyase family enzyme
MPGVSGFDHLSLTCRRAKATQRFYESVLGFRVSARMPQWGMTEISAGAATIVLVDAESSRGSWAKSARGEGENVHHFCLRLKEFDKARLRARLARHRVAIEEEQSETTSEGVEHAFYVRDPEGNLVELRGITTGTRKLRRNRGRRK